VILIGAMCIMLLILTTLTHYEMLRTMNSRLPALAIPRRNKLLVVIFGAFLAHAVEIFLYALAIFLLVRVVDLGTLGDTARISLSTALYFSAETYTSLGYGDFLPGGDLRMLCGAEALNGLLMIGWTVSYTYIAMERFWSDGGSGRPTP
jgi:large-conductance mechanosensitive channel